MQRGRSISIRGLTIDFVRFMRTITTPSKSCGKWYVLGGGRSAGAFDLSELRRKGTLLGVNRAALHTPCDVVFSLDRPFMVRYRDELGRYDGEVHVCVPSKFRKLAPPGATIWNRIGDTLPTGAPGTISHGLTGGGNSGLSALNLAAHLGARRIFLLGFDMEPENGCWYGDFPGPRPTRTKVLKNFRYCAPWYAEHGIEVVNTNPNSAIDCFPCVS